MPLSLKKSVQKITYFLLGCGNSRVFGFYFFSVAHYIQFVTFV
ncbi:hypothetical protein LEP1GSC074_1165 [Leptospira noguchii str. Hook]|uniref:Lipoprotein n=1 Tax=Leptospira noguchii serovar Autumnalis str. ZUN142 TaxID=1085540 RepID=M6U5J5_9LEPT|nr:hypothetical protein LEP1GSC041_2440 [Leptospira noguchii str. 2006001870]EMO28756.1 hypothetical protein LEP1GSC170_3126 [Leptospira interrogans serovar Bataviae str. HAI135]EMO39770.1 hypothetical protein LEP1GSC186_1291 [Leptospira noguchii serovar Autumnalis str. ZUN142]EMS82151.1 hypothetical protein LEP1GSC074_1165 [Leptospira noguchii str. Hook]